MVCDSVDPAADPPFSLLEVVDELGELHGCVVIRTAQDLKGIDQWLLTRGLRDGLSGQLNRIHGSCLAHADSMWKLLDLH